MSMMGTCEGAERQFLCVRKVNDCVERVALLPCVFVPGACQTNCGMGDSCSLTSLGGDSWAHSDLLFASTIVLPSESFHEDERGQLCQ